MTVSRTALAYGEVKMNLTNAVFVPETVHHAQTAMAFPMETDSWTSVVYVTVIIQTIAYRTVQGFGVVSLRKMSVEYVMETIHHALTV